MVGHGPETVHGVGRDVHEVTLADLTLFVLDGHDPAPRHHVVELVGGVRVREHRASARDLELVHQLEVATVGDVLHLTRRHQPPHRDGAVVLHDGLDALDPTVCPRCLLGRVPDQCEV